jgi:hypothetical protein
MIINHEYLNGKLIVSYINQKGRQEFKNYNCAIFSSEVINFNDTSIYKYGDDGELIKLTTFNIDIMELI